VQAVVRVERRRAAPLDGIGELAIHGLVRVRPRGVAAIDHRRAARTEDFDVGAGGARGRCGRHRRLAEPADLVVQHETDPPATVAVRLDADGGAERGLQQVEQVNALVPEDATLDPPCAYRPAGQVAAGDQPAGATVRPDPLDLGGQETADVRGVSPSQTQLGDDLRGLHGLHELFRPAISPAIGRSRNTAFSCRAASAANSACTGGGTANATASQCSSKSPNRSYAAAPWRSASARTAGSLRAQTPVTRTSGQRANVGACTCVARFPAPTRPIESVTDQPYDRSRTPAFQQVAPPEVGCRG
jgi:hypothetical protein